MIFRILEDQMAQKSGSRRPPTSAFMTLH